jgi:penicillin-binding protein 1A
VEQPTPVAKVRRPPRRLRRFSLLRWLFLSIVFGIHAGAGALYYLVTQVNRDLPSDLTEALEYQPRRASLVYSADGELIGEFYLEKRVLADLDRIPQHVQRAFISAEDRRFYEHPGFDIFGIARAMKANLRAGGTKQGASTITQQVTRMLMLSNERSYLRKAREIVLAVRVERELSKEDILHIYLNQVYLGEGAYGVAAAADIYFGKQVDHLTIAEAAMLAGLVQSPSRYSPHNDMKAARARQLYVLNRMFEDRYITSEQVEAARAEAPAIIDKGRPLNSVSAPYFVEHVRRWAVREFGEEAVLHGGLRIYSTLDARTQKAAEAAVRAGLRSLDRWIGFRGPINHLDKEALEEFVGGPARPHTADVATTGTETVLDDIPYVGAVVELPRDHGVTVDIGPQTLPLMPKDALLLRQWKGDDDAVLRRGDLIPVKLVTDERGKPAAALAQTPDVQASALVMDPHTGRVEAMVGGYDFVASQFNRVTQAHRQIGSAIKPFIYATALADGATSTDIVEDAPVAVQTASGVWAPQNYDNKFAGRVTLRTALARSLNTVSVRLLLRTGVDRVVDLMRSLGISSPFTRHISIALGTPDLTLLEVVSAYSAFANGGLLVEPRFVDVVVSGRGEVLLDQTKKRPTRQAIPPELAYLMTDMMQGVIARGTGKKAQALGRPAAGKTGTSTNHRDAWFIGYTADKIGGVWIGRDDFTPIGVKATGGVTALPIWLATMQVAEGEAPPADFPAPDDVFFVRADEESGQPGSPWSSSARLVPFARGTVPARFLGGVPLGPFRSAAAPFAREAVPDSPR